MSRQPRPSGRHSPAGVTPERSAPTPVPGMDEVDRDEAGPLHDPPSYGRLARVPSRPADPLVVFEVLVADGELAGSLGLEQARAVKEVLEWLVDQTTQDPTTQNR